jgi:hypothetical protein
VSTSINDADKHGRVMNKKLLIIVAASAFAGSPAAYAEPVTYDFTGTGYVLTFIGVGGESTYQETTFTGTVTFDVLAAGPSGPDSYSGNTAVQDRSGWVQSDFNIQWAGHSFNPAAMVGQHYSDSTATVFDNDEGVVDRLRNREYYEGSNGDTDYISFAELLRSTNDISWLSGLSFDVTVGLAPRGGPDNYADNYVDFANVSITFNAAEARYDVGGFSGYVALTSLTPRATIDIRPDRINPMGQGVIPVAILTTAAFDAATVDANTVLFGRSGVEAAPLQWALKDVDADGDLDLMLHFVAQTTGIQCGDTSASVAGTTVNGQKFAGSDSFDGRCH